MGIFYVLSVVYLMIMFLLYRKENKELCFISSLIYAIALLFCYNTFIVYFLYLLGIKGSMLLLGIINCLIGMVISINIYTKGKKIQKYFVDKKKLAIFLILAIVVFMVGCFRFRGFRAISFASGDAAVHYRHALEFSEDLTILDKTNTQDEIFGSFVRVMPISYINCGLLFNVFSGIKTYTLFMIYNVFCLVLSALLFLVTIMDTFKNKKDKYVYGGVLALLYVLAYPLSSVVMGFCYLTLSIIVVNLLYLTLCHFKDNLDKKMLLKIIIIFLITFSVFYSYYLFVPAVYLALGIYYIYLFKKKKINFKQMIWYGVMTLIVPFVLGFSYFFITLFIDNGVGIVAEMVNAAGYSYDNITPIVLFILVTIYLVFRLFKKREFNYLNVNLYVLTIYIGIFLVLYALGKADSYYSYKLFYIYWPLVLIYFCKNLEKRKYVVYSVAAFIFTVNIFLYLYPANDFSSFLVKTNIYTYNTRLFIKEEIIFDKDELDIIDNSLEYKDICVNNNRFLALGHTLNKRLWYYSITSNVPIVWEGTGNIRILYDCNTSNFNFWKYVNVNNDYPCLIYFYDNGYVIDSGFEVDNGLVTFEEEKYEVLYQNKAGFIVKRND